MEMGCHDSMPCDDDTFHVTDIIAYWSIPCTENENTISVNVHQNGSAVALFTKTVVGSVDCNNLGNIPLFNGSGTGACDWSNATCSLGS